MPILPARPGPAGLGRPSRFVEHGYDVVVAAEDAAIERAAGDLRRDGGRIRVAAGKIIPDRLKAEQHRKMAEPGSGD